MKSNHFKAVIALLAALGSLMAVTGPATAHPEGPGHHNPMPEHASENMREFAADDHSPQNLAALPSTSCVNGFAGVYPCNNVDLMSFMPLAQIGGTRSNSAGNDIWGWTDSSSGREFALMGRVFGTSFVEVTDPANPVYLGELPQHGNFGSSWRDIKVFQNHAFIVSESRNHGMQVFDLAQLLTVANAPVTFGETAHYNQTGSAHNIIINEDTGFGYIVGAGGKNTCSGGLHMVNLQNPTSPSFAGCFSSDGYTHDAQCVIYNGPDAAHAGREICLNSNEDTVTIVDVTNKSNPVQLSRTGYVGAAYTHQGWLTENQSHFLLDDELDEQGQGHNTRTRVFDVSSLTNPQLVGSYFSNNSAIDHNQYVKGDYSYQSNYRSGLRIIDISGVATASLSEAAFFDIYPADDAAEFNGNWSNYPYFPSGTVVVSGIEQGLFVLRPNLGPSDTPPTVSIASPSSGDTVSGTVTVAASANDDNSVNQVEFRVNGTIIGTDTSAPYTASWDTTTAPEGTAVLTAVATDSIGQTASATTQVTVDNVVDPPAGTVHTSDLDGSTSSAGRSGKWNATVTISVHDDAEVAVANATVSVSWSNGSSGSCTTNASGECAVTQSGLRRNSNDITMSVTSIAAASSTYAPGDNHDPDGDSTGTNITLNKP